MNLEEEEEMKVVSILWSDEMLHHFFAPESILLSKEPIMPQLCLACLPFLHLFVFLLVLVFSHFFLPCCPLESNVSLLSWVPRQLQLFQCGPGLLIVCQAFPLLFLPYGQNVCYLLLLEVEWDFRFPSLGERTP